MPAYTTEREGQIEFYQTFLPMVDASLNIDDILSDSNDGVLNGNLLEFKLRVNDLNAVLFQCVKYLSALRIKGKPVPANIIIVDLNAQTAYLYKSSVYLNDVEKVYPGGASRFNTGFSGGNYSEKFDYSQQLDASKLISVLKSKEWTKIHIDENCIVGWATAFYRAVPSARKEDFIGDDTGKHNTIGEIRRPFIFEQYIYPYTGQSNVRFQYLMDKLNDTLQKKNLGAFYTPEVYAKKTHELLREAIARVPEGNDYVIIDRCAGTGNLEKSLTDEELSHCILSTVEYYEYKVLQEVLGSKVLHIIPPIEADDTFNAGLVRGADALSKEYIDNPVIKQYIDNPNVTIILFENPPYAEANGTTRINGAWKKTFVVEQMKKTIKGQATNDLGNAFIWSAFKYYLRQPTDSYLVYSPIKYWKIHHLINRRFFGGFAFNRRFFHTNIDACICAILWGEEEDIIEHFTLEGYDIDSNGRLKPPVEVKIDRSFSTLSDKYYEKMPFSSPLYDGIACELNGVELTNMSKNCVKTLYDPDMIGYLVANGAGFDNPDLNSGLTIAGRYDAHGFFLNKSSYLTKLPMFCASRYITYNRTWTERARITKSGDGSSRFYCDAASGKLDQWLLKCLLFTCLEMQNHMRSFTGSDGRFYRNELCLDTTNGETLASRDLARLNITYKEQQLIELWGYLLNEVKKTREYDPSLTYGIYQIYDEIDTSYKDDKGNTIWNNVEVHSTLQTIKSLVKDYYNKEIVPTLFKYEFLK